MQPNPSGPEGPKPAPTTRSAGSALSGEPASIARPPSAAGVPDLSGPIAEVRRAITLARTMRVDEAREIADAVRQRHAPGANTPLHLWLWVFEGLLTFYDARESIDIDRLRRAHAVARATGRPELAELAAAWAAHMTTSRLDYPQAAAWLRESNLDRAVLPDARTRACLAAAEVCQDGGRRDDAAAWFERAREIARAHDDRPSMMVSIYNRTVLRLSQLWADVMTGQPPGDDLDAIQAEYRSALDLARATQTEVFALEGVVLRSRIHVLRGQLSQALELLSSVEGQALEDHRELPLASTALPLRAWILARLGRCAEASSLALEALERGMLDRPYPDEVRVTASLLLQADEHCKLGLPRTRLRARLEAASRDLAERRQRAAEAVQAAGLALH